MTVFLPSDITVFERGWLSSNNILLAGEQSVLVDSGYATHAAQTVMLVESALGARPLDLLINTHLHSDHCGGNAALQQRFPAMRTEIPPGEATAVAHWDENALSYLATGQQCPRFRFDDVMATGSERRLGSRVWQIHGAPGHDPNSIVLFEPASRTLISADALWERGFGVVFPELMGEASFDEVSATLDLIELLRPQHVIPGHGPIFGDVAGALSTARRRLDDLSKNPVKHARHAFKVLVKFKLLELHAMPLAQWRIWRSETPYLDKIRVRFFSDRELGSLSDEILAELVLSGAARMEQDLILNL
jgi:glyoxylase-like metal-dependent hydrolase (beta-lactamase superfamily II)